MFAVSFLSSSNQAPREVHLGAVKRLMKYVKMTIDYELSYHEGGEIGVTAYSDADWEIS